MEMIRFNDEQIVAAVFCLKGWKKFSPGFLHSANYYSWKILPTMNMFWKLNDSEKTYESLAKNFPSLFKCESGFLEVIGEQNVIYDCFISGYSPEVQTALASFISCIAG